MIGLTEIEYLTALVCAMSVACSLVCAVVRWFHMCKPYDQDSSYYYPGRKSLTTCYLSNLLFLPIVIWPSNEALVFVGKCMTPMLVCVAVNYTQFRYFSFSKYTRTITGYIFYILNIAWVILMLIVACRSEQTVLENREVFIAGSVSLFGLSLTQYIASVWYFLRKIQLFHESTYTNEEYFPLRTRRFVLILPAIYIASAIICSHLKNGLIVFFPISMFTQVFLLVVYLPAHTNMIRLIKGERGASTGSDFKSYIEENETVIETNEKTLDTLHDNIMEILRSEELFKNPELELSAIVSRTCTSRTYISQALQRDGGFYHIVNNMRMQYADQYLEKNPSSTAEEAALAAGFGSVRSYYRMKNK